MKAKELIEIFKQAPEAEVGYEHIYISYCEVDSPDYIELGGYGKKIEYENQKTGVFVLSLIRDTGEREICCVCHSAEQAERYGKWAVKVSDEEGDFDGVKYVSYEVNNFLVWGEMDD